MCNIYDLLVVFNFYPVPTHCKNGWKGKLVSTNNKTKKLNGHKHYFYIFSEVEGSDLAKTSEFSSVTQQNYYYYFIFVFL